MARRKIALRLPGESAADARARVRSQRAAQKKAPQFARARRDVLSGKSSISAAAKKRGVSTKSLIRHLSGKTDRPIVKESGRYVITGQLDVYTVEQGMTTVYGDEKFLQYVGKYMNQVREALRTNDSAYVTPYEGLSFIDALERRFMFETDLARLRQLQATAPAASLKRDYRRPVRRLAA